MATAKVEGYHRRRDLDYTEPLTRARDTKKSMSRLALLKGISEKGFIGSGLLPHSPLPISSLRTERKVKEGERDGGKEERAGLRILVPGRDIGFRGATRKKEVLEPFPVTPSLEFPVRFQRAFLREFEKQLKRGTLSIVGSGASASVYKFPFGGKVYAVKVFFTKASQETNLKREIHNALKMPAHPNVVQSFFHGVIEEEGLRRPEQTYCLAMEYLEGKELYREILKGDSSFVLSVEGRGSLGISKEVALGFLEGNEKCTKEVRWRLHNVRSAITALSRGISWLHKHGITHRDMKPENVIYHLQESGEQIFKIVDFGLGKNLSNPEGLIMESPETVEEEGKTSSLKPSTPCGSSYYMSPEILLGEASCSTDVWSLGVTFYTMVTQSFPYRQESTPFQLRELQESISFPTFIPSTLRDLIMRCFDPDPSTRISCKEILEHEFVVSPASVERAFRDEISVINRK